MKKYLMVSFCTGYNWKYNLKHPWKIIQHIYYEIKQFIQRGLYGYADSDCWDLDGYLCHWLPTAIRRIGKTSYPGNITFNKWQRIIEKMAVGFETTTKIIDLDYDFKEERRLKKKMDEGFKLFHEYFMHLWI